MMLLTVTHEGALLLEFYL